MNTIKKIVNRIEDEIAERKSFHFEEVYDGDGKRDLFQEGYNYGCLVTLEKLVEDIKKSIELNRSLDLKEKADELGTELAIAHEGNEQTLNWLLRQQD